MKTDFKTTFRVLFERIKKVKHIQMYLATGLALILVIVYFTCIAPSKSKTDNSSKNDTTITTFSNSAEYVDYLENKLESVINKINGVGDTQIIITLEKGFEYVYATKEESRSSTGGTVITTTTLILVDGKPVIKEEIYPVIQGIVVVASGAENVSVKMNIISVISTVIDIDSSRINIIAGNSK